MMFSVLLHLMVKDKLGWNVNINRCFYVLKIYSQIYSWIFSVLGTGQAMNMIEISKEINKLSYKERCSCHTREI